MKREETLDTNNTNESRSVTAERGDSNSVRDIQTDILTDTVWSDCPENPWNWTTWRKWLMMSALGLFGFLALVQLHSRCKTAYLPCPFLLYYSQTFIQLDVGAQSSCDCREVSRHKPNTDKPPA